MSNTEVGVHITESARKYLSGLLEKQEQEVLGVRIFINQPGTPKAETCLAYCRADDIKDDDVLVELDNLTVRYEKRSVPFLDDALIDFSEDKMGGQLTVKAPNAKMPKVSDDSPIEDKINYVIFNEVNPQLAAHGGEASLIEVSDDGYAVLTFGGGCQGCAQIDLTVKEGVEKLLVEKIPELNGVKDETDHSDRSNAYF